MSSQQCASTATTVPTTATTATAATTPPTPTTTAAAAASKVDKPSAFVSTFTLGHPWSTADPFMFCVHHLDHYPAARDAESMAPPRAALAGRRIGADFSNTDGWSMYHGDDVPGFPQHPHAGFETLTIVRRSFCDHSDSMGAKARFGESSGDGATPGDLQWMTAGAGVQHCEMFPLLRTDAGNTLELFQLWLNLPRRSKNVAPYFTMQWGERVPVVRAVDDGGRATSIAVYAGALGDTHALPPPPDSYAADADAAVCVWLIKMARGARWTLPASPHARDRGAKVNRRLYLFVGDALSVDGTRVPRYTGVHVRADVDAVLEAGVTAGNGDDAPVELLLLQGKAIDEPVVQRGPFVANSNDGMSAIVKRYHATGGFGGWPWKSSSPVHARDAGRFATHPDGKTERPPAATATTTATADRS